MAARGGKRDGAGRKVGAVNRATKENKATLEELARAHTSTALATLAKICADGTSETARVAAANALLDRGYGKPAQAVQHTTDPNNPLAVNVTIPDAARAIAFLLASAAQGK